MSSVDVFQISALALVVISVIQMVWAARKPVGWDPPRARPVRNIPLTRNLYLVMGVVGIWWLG